MLYVVEEKDAGLRLDVFLTNSLNEYSRSYIKNLIEKDKVFVNNELKKPGYVLKIQDKIIVNIIEIKPPSILPAKIKINIIHEDDDIIIINKAKGMVVHPGVGNYADTLVNALLYSHKNNLSNINDITRPGIVHRIDKDTTGVIVVAKNDKAHINLASQFKNHSVKREYIAVVKGIISEDNIVINKPIARSTKDRMKMSVNLVSGKEAITEISVIKRYYNSKMTLIKASLKTGRTHQIRVHMKHFGYPVLGDLTYGNENKEFKLDGHLLHAETIGFIHPTNNKYIEFKAEPAKQMSDIIKKLENKEKTSKY